MNTSLRTLSTALLLAIFFYAAPISAEEPAKKTRHRSAITISKETTRITEPVNELGYVDYVAAINQRASKGVTPKNNAAVLLWQALGSKPLEDWKPEHRAKFFESLGMKEPPAEKAPYLSREAYAALLEPEPIAEAGLETRMIDQVIAALEGPWTAKEHADLAAWLEENKLALELIMQATRRTQMYSPMIRRSDDATVIWDGIPMIMLSEYREFARMLAMRAMQATAAGKTEAAWNDLIACWRLGRLAAQGPTLVEGLVGEAIESIAAHKTAIFLHHSKLSDEQIAAMRRQLANLPQRSKAVDKVDSSERFFGLDMIQAIDREGPDALAKVHRLIDLFAPPKSGLAKFVVAIERVLLCVFVDWNLVMQDLNDLYDLSVELGNAKDRRQRTELEAKLTERLAAEERRGKDLKRCLLDWFAGKTLQQIASERISGTTVLILFPGLSAIYKKERQADMHVEMVDTAFALELYQNKHGAYPDKIAALLPTYRKTIPTDIYIDDAPVRYKKTEKGYLLYSVGIDEKDQGGPSEDGDSDDIGFRVPAE